MNITNQNLIKIISLRNKSGLENEVFTVLGDAIYEAMLEKVKMIIHELCTNNKKEILGYF